MLREIGIREALLTISMFVSQCVLGQDFGFLPKFDKEVLAQGSYSSVSFGETEIVGFAAHFGAGLFVSQKVCVNAGYLSMTDATGATVLNGFDGSIKWHLLSEGSSVVVQGDGKLMTKRRPFSHYALLGYRLRELAAEELAPQYSGFNYGYGGNWFVGRAFGFESMRDMFLNAEFDIGNLSSPQGGKSKTRNLSFGFGMVF